MAGPWYVDDGGVPPGDATDGTTWAKAYTSLKALITAKTLASDEIVYVGHDHVESTGTHSGNWTFTGPTSGAPVIIISATQGSDPPTYAKSTTNQVDTSGGAYSITIDGSFALYGVRMKAGAAAGFNLAADTDEIILMDNCTAVLPVGGRFQAHASSGRISLHNLTLNNDADGTTNRSTGVFTPPAQIAEITNLSLTNAAYRTGTFFSDEVGRGPLSLSGCDFSSLNSTCELIEATRVYGRWSLTNILTGATWTLALGALNTTGELYATNIGPADAPESLIYMAYQGAVRSASADSVGPTAVIYRTGGATVEGTTTAWLITTTAGCAEGNPLYTPWIYGTVDSTGSKTFDVYITNDTADFDDSQVWLEVEYLGTADEAQWSLATDHRVITATASTSPNSVSRDDTTSTWNGTGPSFTYKQKLQVPATVNETGQYRARVAVGVASIASSRYFYIDPRVVVS